MFARTLPASFPTPVAQFASANLAGRGVRIGGAGYEVEQPQPPQVDPLAPAPVNPGRLTAEEDRAMRRSLNTLASVGGSVFTATAARDTRLPGTPAVTTPRPRDCQSPARGAASGKPDANGADPRWLTSHESTGRATAGHAK